MRLFIAAIINLAGIFCGFIGSAAFRKKLISKQFLTAFPAVILLTAGAANAQCGFTISTEGSGLGCVQTEETAVWVNTANAVVVGQNIEKDGGGNNWNSGGECSAAFTDFGYAETVVIENDRQKAFGLNHNGTGYHPNSLAFGFFLRNNGTIRITEGGSNRGHFGAYNVGDTLRISVENEMVTYTKNREVLYVSNVTPDFPLRAKGLLRHPNAVLGDVRIGQLSDGLITAFTNPANAGGNPTFQWAVNGSGTGTNNETFDASVLAPGNVITCTLTTANGCAGSGIGSNEIRILSLDNFSPANFFITTEPTISACNSAVEAVKWDSETQVNVNATENRLEKIQGGTNWNAGASSHNSVHDNGSFSFTTEENNRQKAAGLSHSNTNSNVNSIEFAFRMNANGSLRIYESGSNRGTFGNYVAGDNLKISVENGTVHYYHNGELLRVSNNSPELPLIADASLRSEGATISEAEITNLNEGNFIANAVNVGSNPTYQWMVNGVNAGENGPNFSNSELNGGDVITCELTPDLTGCGAATFLSNEIEKVQVEAPAAINFYITGEAAGSACNLAAEAVQWDQSSLISTAAAGNQLEKIQGGNNWNAGGASLNRVHDNGSFRFTTDENNRQKAAGLSHEDANSHINSIEFAFRMEANGSLRIYESGSNRGTFGSYEEGDNFEIAVENGTVHYYHNGELLRVSNTAPELPLLADVSMRSHGATIGKAFITNLNNGVFTANAKNVGDNPVYQWKVNGTNAGENSAVFSDPGISSGDIITCELTPDLGGCGEVVYHSNDIEKIQITAPAPLNFYVRGEVSDAACYSAIEEVQWNSSSLVNMAASGNSIQKIQGGTNWNANASSLNRVFDNGRLRFAPNETNRQKAMGLSHEDANDHINSIQFAFRMESNGSLRIYESGNNRGTFGSFNAGDTLEIAVDNGTVKYFHNSELLYISGNTPNLPLLADASIRQEGGSIGKVHITNLNDGTFSANAENAGDNPVFQWFLNSAPVGDNLPTYTNPAPENGDVVFCALSPDLGGCSDIVYNSNAAKSIIQDVTDQSAFFAEGTVDLGGFGYAAEDLVWNPGSLQNTVAEGNSLLKVQSNNNWNGAAVSFNTVKDEGYFEFIATETNRRRAVGLSNSNTGVHLNNIQFAFYLDSNGSLRIYESGSNRGTFGSYSAGDVFRIAAEAGEVKYYRNGTLIRTSAITPILPLLAHVSIYSSGGTVTNAVIANKTGGAFTANTSDAGENPIYNWKLNGAIVGDGSAEYFNPNVLDGDVIACDITPDLQGCENAEYTSNKITVYGPGGNTDWTGIVSSEWSNVNNWSDGLPDRFRSAFIPAEAPNQPVVNTLSQVKGLTIASGATVALGQSNTLQLYGDLVNNGAFDPGSGTIVLAGPGSRTLSGNDIFFYRAITNLENPSDSIILHMSAVINQEMLLLSGVIVTDGHEIAYRNGAENRFGSENSYVDGVVRKVGSEAFTFPVGRGGTYAPVSISAPADPSSQFTAEYINEDPAEAGYDAGQLDETLTNVGRCEYWMINREAGTSAVSVSLSYGNEQSCGVEDPTFLKVARWNGGMWQDHGYLTHEGDATAGTVTSGSEIAQFSPFTIGTGSGINPLPIQLIDFAAKAEGGNVRLTWITASEINNDFFTLERSSDGVNFQRLANVSGAGNSNTRLEYNYTDLSPYPGTSYYRLTQTDYDGQFEIFPIKSVTIQQEEFEFDLFPNPTDGAVTVRISEAESGAEVRVFNTAGQTVHSERFNSVQLNLDLSYLPAGVYIVHLAADHAVQSKKLVIR